MLKVCLLIVIVFSLLTCLVILRSFKRVRKSFSRQLAEIISTSPRKWIVGGMMGAGKSTFSKSLEEILAIEHVHIDKLGSRENVLNAIREADKDGWVAEAGPWDIPEELVQKTEIIVFLDYDNIVNYLRLFRRGISEWRDPEHSCSGLWQAIIHRTILDLGRIVFLHGKDNRAGWRQKGLLPGISTATVKCIHCVSPAELKILEEALRSS